MDIKYLSPEKLAGFEKYKYNSIDKSVLSNYVMHPFWNWCVQFCPKWVAPNLLTFTGFLLTVLNFLIFSWYDYDFQGQKGCNSSEECLPRFAWLFTSISLFTSYTFDGIDGKQARRTGTSGPLGELFDHGVDSYSAVLISTCLYSIFGRHAISPLRMFFVLWNIFLNFYLTHWEKYNTGIMFLPYGYDFTMLGSVLILLITSVIGPKGWDINLPWGLTTGVIFELTLYISAILSSHFVILWNIYKSYRDKTGHMRSFLEALRPLFPFVLFFVISSIWAIFSPHNILDKDPRAYYFLMGTIFSNISCRLIVSQMSNTRCEGFNFLMYPFTVATFIALAGPVSAIAEMSLLYIMCFITTVAHIHYGASVVKEMCHHFKIRCFHIKSSNS